MTNDTTPAVQSGTAPLARPSAFASKNAELWKFAEALSRSELIPRAFQNKPANVFLALQIADRMDLDCFAVMANMGVIHGTPAFAAKFVIGLANMRGPFRGPLRYRVTGEGTPDLKATCYAILRDDGTEVETTFALATAVKAGWTKDKPRKDGNGVELSKYTTMPAQMCCYRAATFLVRLYCPEVAIMGARTLDEAEDVYASGQAEPEYREATASNPLRAELEAKNTADGAAAHPREAVIGEQEMAESAPARERSSEAGATSPHAKAIGAFVALGVGSNVIEAEIAHQEGEGHSVEDVTVWLRALHKAVKADGPRALITRLRSEKACDLLDRVLDPLDVAPKPAAKSITDDLFGPEPAEPRED